VGSLDEDPYNCKAAADLAQAQEFWIHKREVSSFKKVTESMRRIVSENRDN